MESAAPESIGPRRRSGKNLVAMGRSRSKDETKIRRRGSKAVASDGWKEDEEWESASQVITVCRRAPFPHVGIEPRLSKVRDTR
jgi:hypothetical protein